MQEGTTFGPVQRNHQLRADAWRYLRFSMITASLSAVCFVAGAGLLAASFFDR